MNTLAVSANVKRDHRQPERLRRELKDTLMHMSLTPTLLDIGNGEGIPPYQLLTASLASEALLASCLPVSCDRVRKKWSDVRALVRLHDIRFLITVNGYEAAVLYRNPSYKDDHVSAWLSEHQKRVLSDTAPMCQLEAAVRALELKLADHDRRLSLFERSNSHEKQ